MWRSCSNAIRPAAKGKKGVAYVRLSYCSVSAVLMSGRVPSSEKTLEPATEAEEEEQQASLSFFLDRILPVVRRPSPVELKETYETYNQRNQRNFRNPSDKKGTEVFCCHETLEIMVPKLHEACKSFARTNIRKPKARKSIASEKQDYWFLN